MKPYTLLRQAQYSHSQWELLDRVPHKGTHSPLTQKVTHQGQYEAYQVECMRMYFYVDINMCVCVCTYIYPRAHAYPETLKHEREVFIAEQMTRL